MMILFVIQSAKFAQLVILLLVIVELPTIELVSVHPIDVACVVLAIGLIMI